MKEDLRLARPYFILLAIFAVARFAQGPLDVPYAKGHQVFSIIILTVISCLYYGAFTRRWRNYRLMHVIGLAVLLGFIGVKLVLEALHENNVPFINGGEPLDVPVPSIGLSLAVIVVILTVTTVASLVVARRGEDATAE